MNAGILDLDQAIQPAPPEPKRDRYGRYLITPAAGGKPTAHTRATTFAKAVDDQEGLINWSMRMTALGLAKRADLYAGVASCRDDDTATLRGLVEQAKEAGGATAKAGIGTAIHRFCERVDLGETPVIPDPYRGDVDAYRARLAEAGVTIDPRWVERIAVVPSLTVAGTFDRIVRLPDGTLAIADIKTGSLDYAALSISVQLALYANAATLYDPTTDAHEPMPAVRRDLAIVIHLPAGTGTCTLHGVDIEAGWRHAQLCAQVREARAAGKRKGVLLAPLPRTLASRAALPAPTCQSRAALPAPTCQPAEPAVPLPATPVKIDTPTLRSNAVERLAAIKAHGEARAMMARLWPAGVPPMRGDHQHTADELALILDICATVEAEHSLALVVDPRHAQALADRRDDKAAQVADATAQRRGRTGGWKAPDEAGHADDRDIEQARQAVAAATPEQRAALNTWLAEGDKAGRPWSLRAARTGRRLAIYRAALLLGQYVDGEVERALVAAVKPDAVNPSVVLGAALGSLTISEATALRLLCEALDSGDAALCYSEDGTPTIQHATLNK